jgi:hypothetical protein
VVSMAASPIIYNVTRGFCLLVFVTIQQKALLFFRTQKSWAGRGPWAPWPSSCLPALPAFLTMLVFWSWLYLEAGRPEQPCSLCQPICHARVSCMNQPGTCLGRLLCEPNGLLAGYVPLLLKPEERRIVNSEGKDDKSHENTYAGGCTD